MAHTKFTYNWNWDGTETEILSRCTDEIGQVQPTRAQVAKFFNVPADHDHSFNVPGNRQFHSAVEDRARWERSQCDCLRFSRLCCSWGASRSRSRRRYGVGRTPTPEEIRAWDISISPTGTELPPGHGSAKEGAQVYRAKGCAGCHGANLTGGRAPVLVKADKPARCRPLGVGASTPVPRAVRDDCLGLHQSRHASQQRGDAHCR